VEGVRDPEKMEEVAADVEGCVPENTEVSPDVLVPVPVPIVVGNSVEVDDDDDAAEVAPQVTPDFAAVAANVEVDADDVVDVAVADEPNADELELGKVNENVGVLVDVPLVDVDDADDEDVDGVVEADVDGVLKENEKVEGADDVAAVVDDVVDVVDEVEVAGVDAGVAKLNDTAGLDAVEAANEKADVELLEAAVAGAVVAAAVVDGFVSVALSLSLSVVVEVVVEEVEDDVVVALGIEKENEGVEEDD
jgi:hypothetical protein